MGPNIKLIRYNPTFQCNDRFPLRDTYHTISNKIVCILELLQVKPLLKLAGSWSSCIAQDTGEGEVI